MTVPVVAFLGLGSNLGDRQTTFVRAVAALAACDGIEVAAVSSVIETAPVGDADQPPFLNAVIEVDTALEPRALLECCQDIERAHGRDRSTEQRWGPRTLDIDLLLHGDAVVDEPGLRIPHPRLHERLFVLVPLAEIAPRVRHPRLERSVESLCRDLENREANTRTSS